MSGHAMRSEDAVNFEVLIFLLVGGALGRGRPRLRLINTFRADLTDRLVVLDTSDHLQFWKKSPQSNCNIWRSLVEMGDNRMDPHPS